MISVVPFPKVPSRSITPSSLPQETRTLVGSPNASPHHPDLRLHMQSHNHKRIFPYGGTPVLLQVLGNPTLNIGIQVIGNVSDFHRCPIRLSANTTCNTTLSLYDSEHLLRFLTPSYNFLSWYSTYVGELGLSSFDPLYSSPSWAHGHFQRSISTPQAQAQGAPQPPNN